MYAVKTPYWRQIDSTLRYDVFHWLCRAFVSWALHASSCVLWRRLSAMMREVSGTAGHGRLNLAQPHTAKPD